MFGEATFLGRNYSVLKLTEISRKSCPSTISLELYATLSVISSLPPPLSSASLPLPFFLGGQTDVTDQMRTSALASLLVGQDATPIPTTLVDSYSPEVRARIIAQPNPVDSSTPRGGTEKPFGTLYSRTEIFQDKPAESLLDGESTPRCSIKSTLTKIKSSFMVPPDPDVAARGGGVAPLNVSCHFRSLGMIWNVLITIYSTVTPQGILRDLRKSHVHPSQRWVFRPPQKIPISYLVLPCSQGREILFVTPAFLRYIGLNFSSSFSSPLLCRDLLDLITGPTKRDEEGGEEAA